MSKTTSENESIKELLKAQFQPVMSEICFSLFISLIEYAERFEKDGNNIVCFFPKTEDREADENKLIIEGPLNEDVLTTFMGKVPDSYFTFLSVCGSMLFGESGTFSQLALTPGFGGTLHHIGKEIMVDYTGEESSPIDIGFNIFYFFKRGNFNQLFVSDGIKSLVNISNDPVEIFLRELHYEFNDHFKDAQHRHNWITDLPKLS